MSRGITGNQAVCMVVPWCMYESGIEWREVKEGTWRPITGFPDVCWADRTIPGQMNVVLLAICSDWFLGGECKVSAPCNASLNFGRDSQYTCAFSHMKTRASPELQFLAFWLCSRKTQGRHPSQMSIHGCYYNRVRCSGCRWSSLVMALLDGRLCLCSWILVSCNQGAWNVLPRGCS